MTKIIVNADDFGYSEGVNYGVIESHKKGIVTSATLMTNMPGAVHAAALAKRHQKLGVGIHLVLTCGKPIAEGVDSLIDQKGNFLSFKEIVDHGKEMDIAYELESQIKHIFSLGIKPTHIDSHHHIHGTEPIIDIVSHLASKYQLPIRKMNMAGKYENQLKAVEYFNCDFYGENISIDMFKQILDKASSYHTAEIMCHPAFLDHEILKGSSYNLLRVKEYEILIAYRLKEEIKKRRMQLVNYNQI